MRAVNLLPKDYGKQRSFVTPQNAPFIVAGVGGLLATTIVAAAFMSAHGQVAAAQEDLDAARAELAATPQPPAGPTATDTALATEKSARLTAVSAALGTRIAWDRVLREFSLVLPDDVWLTSLTMKTPETASPTTPAPATTAQDFQITGQTYSHASVARLLSRLTLVPDLSGVTLTSSVRGGDGTVQFAITAGVKGAPAPAPPAPPPVVTDTTATTTSSEEGTS